MHPPAPYMRHPARRRLSQAVTASFATRHRSHFQSSHTYYIYCVFAVSHNLRDCLEYRPNIGLSPTPGVKGKLHDFRVRSQAYGEDCRVLILTQPYCAQTTAVVKAVLGK